MILHSTCVGNVTKLYELRSVGAGNFSSLTWLVSFGRLSSLPVPVNWWVVSISQPCLNIEENKPRLEPPTSVNLLLLVIPRLLEATPVISQNLLLGQKPSCIHRKLTDWVPFLWITWPSAERISPWISQARTGNHQVCRPQLLYPFVAYTVSLGVYWVSMKWFGWLGLPWMVLIFLLNMIFWDGRNAKCQVKHQLLLVTIISSPSRCVKHQITILSQYPMVSLTMSYNQW